MTSRLAVRSTLAVAITATCLVAAAAGSLLLRDRPLVVWYDLYFFHNGPPAVILGWLGVLVATRQPQNRIAVLMSAIAALSAVHVAVASLADRQLVAAGLPGPIRDFDDDIVMASLPFGAAVALCVMNVLWTPVLVLAITALPLLFPDGELPGPRWRAVPIGAACGTAALMTAFAIDAWPTSQWTTAEAPDAVGLLLALGGLLVLLAAIASFVALAMRWRRASVAQLPLFRVVGVTAGLLALVGVATYPWQHIWIPAALVALHLMLVAYGLAVARYGLHDIEPFLGRAVAAALVTILIAVVYATVVLGIGSIAQVRFDNPVLPVVALATVALIFDHARRHTRRLVDRWVYRADTDRTEVMSKVAAHANRSGGSADVLDDVAALLVRSTGAQRVEIWLADDEAPAATAGQPGAWPSTLVGAIVSAGDELGELRLLARLHADLVADAAAIVADVAHALAVMLRNDQLSEQLAAQLDELRSSRRRLVEAQERARHDLERDLHDGAQTRLIAMRLRIGVIRARLAAHPDAQHELDDLADDLDATVRSLRSLVRGLAPPILQQAGPAAALRSHSSDLPVAVQVEGRCRHRHHATIESATYFCCLEALQNAVSHGRASTVHVVVDGGEHELRFEVVDDGIGFDRQRTSNGTGLANIADRVHALGGTLAIESRPGNGTRVVGTIPAQSGAPAPCSER